MARRLGLGGGSGLRRGSGLLHAGTRRRTAPGLARAHLRPIFLPVAGSGWPQTSCTTVTDRTQVKSTSVVSDKGVWQTWIDRPGSESRSKGILSGQPCTMLCTSIARTMPSLCHRGGFKPRDMLRALLSSPSSLPDCNPAPKRLYLPRCRKDQKKRPQIVSQATSATNVWP